MMSETENGIESKMTVTIAVSQNEVDAYAVVSGDFNPIHTQIRKEKLTPNQTNIVHGMYFFGFIFHYLDSLLKEFDISDIDMKFKAPVYVDEKIIIKVSTIAQKFDKKKFNIHGSNRVGEIKFIATASAHAN